MFTDSFKRKISNFADSVAEDGYWICDDVFKEQVLKKIISSFESKRKFLRPALIGKSESKTQINEIRNDHIHWLNEDETDFLEVWSFLNLIKDKIKSELFLPIKRFEAHASLYSPGHFYKRHKDQHKNSPSRLISAVLYFNEWTLEDAGELVIYKPSGEEIKVSPSLNRVVFFRSELEHEVLTSKAERKSITIWFRDDL